MADLPRIPRIFADLFNPSRVIRVIRGQSCVPAQLDYFWLAPDKNPPKLFLRGGCDILGARDGMTMPTQKKKARNPNGVKPRNPDLIRAQRILRSHLPALRERYGVTSLGMFGSYVRGEQKRRSDLDVLVEFERAPSLFKYGELEDHLSDLVGMKVDLVMKRSLKPRIGRQILAEVVRL